MFYNLTRGVVSSEVVPEVFWNGPIQKKTYYHYEGWKCNNEGKDANALMGYTALFVTYLYTINSTAIHVVFNKAVYNNDLTNDQFRLYADGSSLAIVEHSVIDKTVTLRAESPFSSTANLALSYYQQASKYISTSAGPGGVAALKFDNKTVFNNRFP